MTPALFTSTSKRFSFDLKVSAALLMEAKDVKSRGRCSISASGESFLRSAIAALALDSVRAAR